MRATRFPSGICGAVTNEPWPEINRARLEAVFQSDAYVDDVVERSRTRRTAAYAIDVTSEADGTLRATFQAMAFRTGRWHLGEDAWPDEWRATH
jgi:hypothetical protein